MNLPLSHQRDRNPNFFGRAEGRFLFKSLPAGPAHAIPHDEVSQTAAEARERRGKFAKALDAVIKKYNQKYGEEPKEGGEDVEYGVLPLLNKNPAALKRQIKVITKKLKEKAGRGWADTLPDNPQYKILTKIVRSIEEYQKLAAQGPELVREARRGRLLYRHEQMTKALDRKEVWSKRPVYKELNGIFETVADQEEFRNVWKTPAGLEMPAQREARELFLAIMAEKTNGFKKRFVLGDAFGNDAAANIRNFPFIYNEFLKHEGGKITGEAVSLRALTTAKSDAEEAKNKLRGVQAVADIIKNNADAGLETVPTVPTVPDTKKWKERLRVLTGNIYKLGEKAAQNPQSPRAQGWKSAADILKAYKVHAQAYLKLSRLKDREKTVQSRFTRLELSRPNRRKLVMELAMKKFVKAMDIVDRPYGNANWQQTLHPTVRRLLIANIYETGVARYQKNAKGEVDYEDNIKSENIWMLSALALSDYFNFKEIGEKMDPDHEALLKAAWLGSRTAAVVEQLGVAEEILQDLSDKKTEELAKFPPALVERFRTFSPDKLKDTLDQIKKNKGYLIKFTQRTREAIKNPYSPESQKFIADMKKDAYAQRLSKSMDDLGRLGVISKIDLEADQRRMYDLQINFKTAELQEGNTQMFFEALGMHIEGVFPAYLDYIKKHPKLRTDYWDYLLLGSKAEFKQLIDMFRVILPDDIAGGKADFIAGLIAIRKKYKGKKSLTQIMGSLEEGSEDAVVLDVFRMLKLHLGTRAETAAISDRKAKEIDAKLRGVHIGDKISEYVGGVWAMLTGPGQSLANRAAGLVLMYGFYKAARKAMKGEGKSGKMLRALFVAGAVEIAAKEITGRGILDRAGLDAINGAMEGTYEEVLRQDAEEHMEDKDITPEAHGAALKELNDVPFNQVMAWYESSDPNGMPQPPGSKDKFPRQIDLKLIAPKVTWVKKDKEREARHVVYETVKHFFGYVGEKANKRDAVYGKEALKERWIKMYDNPNYKPKYTTYNHNEWFKAFGVKKSDITWQMVMRAEIDPKQVDLTKNKTTVGMLTATAKEWYESLAQWTREHVYNPGSGYAETFFDSMGEHAQDAKEFFSKVYEASGRKVYFGKEKVILWYGEHQYEIRRIAENHWKLLVTGVELPFKVIGAVDNWAIPWTLTKLKQVEESLRNKGVEALSDDRDLTENDIVAPGILPNTSDIKLNPKFTYYGLDQGNFQEAFRANPKDRFYKDLGTNIGYYISEMTPQAAGINLNDPLYANNPDAVNQKMTEASRKKAVQRFKNAGMSRAEIKKYLYSMHQIKFTRSGKMYVFWRMPLKDSPELYLKETGHWADFSNINKYKGREPFIVDPSQTSWENLERAFVLNVGPTRTLLGTAGSYLAQIPRFMLWHIEFAGRIVKAIGKEVIKNPQKQKEFMQAVDGAMPGGAKQQVIDEFFTSAGSKHKALSAFYKDPVNAKLYEFALDYAKNRHQPLNLSIMSGLKGHQSDIYTDQPANIPDMVSYYIRVWAPRHNLTAPANLGQGQDLKKLIDLLKKSVKK